jgi:AAA+ ATPase superfamily predicted ATPase
MLWLNRTDELARLHRLAKRREGGLAVVWGRRRVGKTRLLLEWVRTTGGIYFVADETAAAVQRRRLAEAIEPRLPGFAGVEYPDWGSLLTRFVRDATAARLSVPLVLDELPYLVAASPDLPSVLQRFVDHDAKQARLVLALAGSSQRMMQDLVFDRSAPLFGRATEAFEVRPMSAAWIAEAHGLRNAADVVRAWSVWGGLPRYWELAEPFADRREAVHDLVLDPAGVLHDEPSRLLVEELPPATSLRPVLDAIGAGAHKLGEIASRIGSPATSLARPMTRLVELGLVRRETPFGEPERSTKRALYRLGDPFLRLWFSLVAPKRTALVQGTRKERLALFDARSPHLDAASWEELCRLATPRLADVLGAEFGQAQRYWSGSEPEWDVVAESSRKGVHLLGEAKWLGGPPTAASIMQLHDEMRGRGQPPFARADLTYALFLPVLPRTRPRHLPANVHLVDAKAVLAALR